jgi:hypothetical protein
MGVVFGDIGTSPLYTRVQLNFGFMEHLDVPKALELAAAKAVGMSKTSILRSIKTGRISAGRDEFGQWAIEPCELHRVYPPSGDGGSKSEETGSTGIPGFIRRPPTLCRLDDGGRSRAGRLEELAMHPTVKPVALVADAIKDCSRRGGLVLDPFCGSGTILIAAERTGRRARALEIDPAYVDVAVRRWQDYTGKSAFLAASGETFERVEEHNAGKPRAA